MLRSAIARGAHVDTHHRVRPLKWFRGKTAGGAPAGGASGLCSQGTRDGTRVAYDSCDSIPSSAAAPRPQPLSETLQGTLDASIQCHRSSCALTGEAGCPQSIRGPTPLLEPRNAACVHARCIARRRHGHFSVLTTRWAVLWARRAVWDVGVDHCGGCWAQWGGRMPARAQSGRQFPMGARHARGPACVCPSPRHCRDSVLSHPRSQRPRRAQQWADGRSVRMNLSIEPRCGAQMSI